MCSYQLLSVVEGWIHVCRCWHMIMQVLRETGLWSGMSAFVSPPRDGCPRCDVAVHRVDIDDKATWPPFRLGCRCNTLFNLD